MLAELHVFCQQTMNVIKANNQNESKSKQAIKIAYDRFQDKLDNFNGTCSQTGYMCRFATFQWEVAEKI